MGPPCPGGADAELCGWPGPGGRVIQRTTPPAGHCEHVLLSLSHFCQEAAEVRLLGLNCPYHLALVVCPEWWLGLCLQIQPCPGPGTSGRHPVLCPWGGLEQPVACGVS